MFTKVKRSFKRAMIRAIRQREQQALFQVANMIKHEYPANTSLHEIVRDLRGEK